MSTVPPRASAEQVDFLLADANVGLTFARLAAESPPGSPGRRRNRAHAARALETVRYHAGQVSLSLADQDALTIVLSELARSIDDIVD